MRDEQHLTLVYGTNLISNRDLSDLRFLAAAYVNRSLMTVPRPPRRLNPPRRLRGADRRAFRHCQKFARNLIRRRDETGERSVRLVFFAGSRKRRAIAKCLRFHRTYRTHADTRGPCVVFARDLKRLWFWLKIICGAASPTVAHTVFPRFPTVFQPFPDLISEFRVAAIFARQPI